MSSVPLKDADDAVFRPDTFTRVEGAETVHMQAVVPVDPVTGAPNLSTEATLLALKEVADNLLAAAELLKTATESLDAKTVAVDTSSISGTVALDVPTIAALQTVEVAVSNFTDNALTDAQLRVAPVETSDATLATIQNSLNTLNETIVVLLSVMIEKMPRIQANDRLLVDLAETSLGSVSSISTLSNVTNLANLQSIGSSTFNVTKAADGIPTHLSNAGAMHLYNNIIVS